MSNSKIGAAFERKFCRLLSEYGFWVHRVSQNIAGQQPADVIAVKDGEAFLIDCKVCTNDFFSIDRVEPNQHNAMELWRKCGNRNTYFALEDSQGCVYMVKFRDIRLAEDLGKKRLSILDDPQWMTKFDDWAEGYLK